MIFKHLLPRAKAWRITVDKYLRQFFEGLTVALVDNVKEFFDTLWNTLDPDSTTELSAFEVQFGLPETDITTQQRRDRLSGTWKAFGGQSPRYIQDTLQNSGFDVYVYDWWVPGTEAAINVNAAATPRDPSVSLVWPYYALVNILYVSAPDLIVLAGEAIAAAGEVDAEAGNYVNFIDVRRVYDVPTDPVLWPYFLYIGGSTFGSAASVPENRRDEFEALCLKICPLHLWIGAFIKYGFIPSYPYGGYPPVVFALPLTDTSLSIYFLDSVDYADSFNVYYSESPGVTITTGTLVDSALSSPVVHSGLTAGTTYYYIVTAENDFGESSASVEFSQVPADVPGIPLNLTVTPGDTTNLVEWDAVAGADTYTLYWSTSQGVTIYSSSFNGIITNFRNDGGRVNGTTYYYRVVAVNSNGKGSFSDEASGTPAA